MRHAPGEVDVVIASAADLALPPPCPVSAGACAGSTPVVRSTPCTTDARRSPEVYLRLAVPLAFATDCDRILDLDGEVFVQAGGLTALLAIGTGGRPR